MTNDRFQTAIAAFDSYHAKDPGRETVNGEAVPKELLYAQRMSERIASFYPGADEVMQLAARCQHIGRWEIPREKYPMDRKGYLQWRSEAKLHHARTAEKILEQCGYDAPTIDKVKVLILKKELLSNRGTQVLEDVACLVFLQYYANDFAEKHSDEKVIDILRKTMKKMSDSAKKAVGEINIPAKLRSLMQRAAEH